MSDAERWMVEESITSMMEVYDLALSALCAEDAAEKQMYLERIVERCTVGNGVEMLHGILGWQREEMATVQE